MKLYFLSAGLNLIQYVQDHPFSPLSLSPFSLLTKETSHSIKEFRYQRKEILKIALVYKSTLNSYMDLKKYIFFCLQLTYKCKVIGEFNTHTYYST